MQHTDKNYEIQMNSINEKLIKMSSILEEQFIKALKVLSTRDENLANDIIETDKQINDLNHDISDTVFQIIAMRQPMADDLSFLFCSIKIIRDLERIGDHLVTVAKKGYRINSSIPPEFIEKLEILGNKASVMTHDALNCLFERKLIFKFLNKIFVIEEEKDNSLLEVICLSTSILVIKIAVNNDVNIPINNVVAKPLIGPVPNV